MQAVEHIETLWVPMSDGSRLAARVWLPEDARTRPVPVVLEYIPYRRRDGTRLGDDLTHPWLAAHGYACVRLDIRGTGDSDGVIRDEYTAQEQDDAVEAIAWLAAQPWCNGSVGMMGISWGGFNSLQVAARRPPALKAIITICSTDDRYADDMHYMGGGLITGNLEWGSFFFTLMGLPPDPVIVGEQWRERWMERLEAAHPVFADWMEHPWRDDYWRHGSVCEDFQAITCPVLAVGGWADGYSNTVFRLLQGLHVSCRGIVGPWGHKYPHVGVPGPAIGFLTEALRWWDHWLKGEERGVLQDPLLRAFVSESYRPAAHLDAIPGRWVAEPHWPSPTIEPRDLRLAPSRLVDGAVPDSSVLLASPHHLGAAAGEWCPYGLGGVGPELPADQRSDDGLSLVFDTDPLAEPWEILGAPVLQLSLKADRPVAQLVARLCDVAPDGMSTRITYGILNLTHREGHAAPVPLEPGQAYQITLQLNECGHRFLPGHRVRLALSSAYWPILWPAPEAATLELLLGQASFTLPLRQARSEDTAIAFEPPEAQLPMAATVMEPSLIERSQQIDVGSNGHRLQVTRIDGRTRLEPIGVERRMEKHLDYIIHPDAPDSARSDAVYELLFRSDGWDAKVRTRSAVSCTAGSFIVEADIEAFEDGRRFFSRSWTRSVPRRLV